MPFMYRGRTLRVNNVQSIPAMC